MLRKLVIALFISLCLTPARAADYPARPVTLVVAFTPGGPSDVLSRIVGKQLEKILGQTFIIDNRPGGAGNIAAEVVAHAAPDGYTLLMGNNSILATNAALYKKLSYDAQKDFAPISLVGTQPNILVVNPSVPANSMGELIALAKQKPGEIFYASTGVGAAPHLSGELFNARAGIKTVHVPYQGSPQAVTDLIAGRTSMMFSPASAVMPHIESGALKGLASAASKRPSIAPNLPTMAEAGLPDFDTSIWFGLMAPLGTPPEVIDKLARAVNDALTSNEVLSSLKTQGFDTLGGSPEEFARTITRDVARWTIAAQAAGMRK